MKALFFGSLALFFFLLSAGCSSQPTLSVSSPAIKMTEGPKLVVGITVDQMRNDYLYRFWDDFSEGGFKRMITEGSYCSQHHFGYTPTYTGPGHASIYTGTTPRYHGIVGNDWFDRSGKMVYCAEDSTCRTTGAEDASGQMSPHRLLSTTITDELRLFSQFRSKVIGISLKDRGAILPAGSKPNGAYWFDGNNVGKWVTSDYYTDRLPDWVEEFNANYPSDSLLAEGWNLLLPEEHYAKSYDDNNPYERPFFGQARAAFPYDFSSIEDRRYNLIKGTPIGAQISTDFAIAAIEGERLGVDQHCDFLTLSYSNTDYAGHQFGPQAVEVQDTYLRLDRELERLLNYLDQHIGQGEYLVFLTADHGGAPVPSFMQEHQMPGGYWKPQVFLDSLASALNTTFGSGPWISNYSNEQVYFNEVLAKARKVSIEDLCELGESIADSFDEIQYTVCKKSLLTAGALDPIIESLKLGIHPQRSGDLILLLTPGFIEYGYQGTTHGSPYSYDSHVPLIFYGKGIAHMEVNRKTYIRDIAPTLARMLRISQPTGTTGEVIHELFR